MSTLPQRHSALALRVSCLCFAAALVAGVVLFAALLLAVSSAQARIVALGPPVQANTDFVGRGGRQTVNVAALPDGGFVVVWEGLSSIGLPPAFGRYFDAMGTPVGPPFQLERVFGIAWPGGPPPIAASEGGFVAASGFSGAVFLRAFGLDGEPGGVQMAEVATSADGGRVLTATSRDHLILVWRREQQLPSPPSVPRLAAVSLPRQPCQAEHRRGHRPTDARVTVIGTARSRSTS
jgi:hypothetical protein